MKNKQTGCSSVWPEFLARDQDAGGSNPLTLNEDKDDSEFPINILYKSPVSAVKYLKDWIDRVEKKKNDPRRS